MNVPAKTWHTIALYVADRWEHVCPVVRMVGPAQQGGLQLIKGNDWEGTRMRVFPERVSEANLVVVQRDFPRYVEEYESVMAQARAHGKPVVYELDDLLTELPEQHPDYRFYREARAAILQAAVEADAVTGSTPLLCDYLRAFNQNAWLLPNYLDDRLWTFRTPSNPVEVAAHRPVIVGYLGGHSHAPDLELIAPVLARILQRYGAGVLVKFWGIAPPADLRGQPNVEWTVPGLVDYAAFAAYFIQQECDVFVAPLRDNLFNRCKSSLKFLEYSTLGVAGVYSRLAPYASVVVHRKNGFLASTPEEWEEYLSLLIENPSLRYAVGLEAQRTVREHWLLSSHAHEWSEVYGNIAASVSRLEKSDVTVRVARQLRVWHRELESQLIETAKATRALNAQLAEKEQAVQALQAQLAEKEQAVQALQAQVAEKAQTVQALSAQIATITNSTGWGLLQMLWHIRLWFAPRGSWRERVLRLGMRGLGVWRREGLVILARKAARKGVNKILHRPLSVAPAQQLGVALTFTAENGTRCPTPAISLIIAKNDATPPFDEQTVAQWLAAQVCRSVEVVVWDRAAASARVAGDSKPAWEARDVQSLCAGVRGRYVCTASPDLLQQNEMYLEANLIALETEALAFTINVHGNADWVTRRIEAGRLPGNSTFPLLRQVVRKDCLRNDYVLDLSAWLAAQNKTPVVVGKIITHTTNRSDAEDALPFESKIDGVDLLILDRRIVTRLDRAATWGTIPHVLHPVDSVLMISPEPSSLPTVLVVMPFLAVGGAERVHLDVMRRLKDQFRFVMITLEPFDASLGTTADAFREVTPYTYTAPDYLAMPLNFSIMTYLIERFQPRTLYIANGTTWIYNALHALKACFPHLRMVNQVYDHQAGWINRYEPALAACLDAHIAVNRKICDAYVARGADPHQVYQIFHSVDEVEFDPARYSQAQRRQIAEKLGLPEGRKVITFIGRLHPQKRPMDFVELARRFASDPSVIFLMVGDGPLGEVVESETTRIGLKNLVRHSFYRPSSDIFAVSDVVVMPSEYEGMPLVILEAQAMGTPVVATDVGNNQEVLELTRGGVIVPHIGDVTALSAGLDKILRAPIDPASVRAATLTHFSMQKMVTAYRRVLLGEADA